MPEKSSNFLYSFFILFLCILLAMFLMFTIMVNYDRDTATGESFSPESSQEGKIARASEAAFRDLTPLYRANLFAIDLCLIVLTEVSLIVLFVKFTIPAALVATATMVLIMADAADTLRGELIPRLLSRFVSNRYATLSHTDLVLLIILSGLIMAFVVSVLLKQHGMKMSEAVQQDSARPTHPSTSSLSAEPSE
jgi:preprotein translocase subunit SecG